MDDDQQFCLRWNNHQSTLISVFDTLLENETLVDCTLAAEGKFLKAHKVVLSACSPYFATLLQEQYDKHPIFILKDVKYQELRAMMDYMYRGEVNISQDQLAALLKAAESLQIKGLSDSRTSGSAPVVPNPIHHRAAMPTAKLSAGYTLEQTKRARIAGPAEPEMGSREGSSSPSRRRRKVRRRSIENAMADVHDNSNSSQHLQQSQANTSGLGAITAAASALAAAAAAAAPSTQSLASNVPLSASTSSSTAVTTTGTTLSSSKKTDNVKGTTQQQQQQQTQQQQHDAMNIENAQGPASATTATGSLDTETTDGAATAAAADKSNHKQQMQQQHKQAKDSLNAGGAAASSSTELVIEPKAEYDDEANDEPVEDLTLDEEDMGMDDLDQNAGTSQGGEGSSQGYAPWQHDRSQDELLLATQEAQQRDPQGITCEFPQVMIENGHYLQVDDQNQYNNNANNATKKSAATKAAKKAKNPSPKNGKKGGGGAKKPNGGRAAAPVHPDGRHHCPVCTKSYLRKRHLQRHMRDECIGIPPRFSCDLCTSRFRRKYHMVRHLTSKHGIPANVAQRATGGAKRSTTKAKKTQPANTTASLNNVNFVNCDNGLPENLTIRKENYQPQPPPPTNRMQHPSRPCQARLYHHHNLNLDSASSSLLASNDSRSDCAGSYTSSISPGSHRMPPLTPYGLTDAISAISAAAAHVDERDAKILLEAAAAAAQAAANNNMPHSSNNNNFSNVMPPAMNEDSENIAQNQVNMNSAAMDEEWKMKLSLQLISNSLLKERLMNSMPFAYQNN